MKIWENLNYTHSCFFIAFLLFVTTGNAQSDVRTFAEQMPYFMGCGDYKNEEEGKRDCSNENLVNFIANNLEYPIAAKAHDIEGTVMVDFVIDEIGAVTQAKVVYDIGGDCGEAALAVLAAMPRWEPARQDGEPVKVRLTMPVGFTISSPESDGSETYRLAWGTLLSDEVTREELQNNLQKKIYVRDMLGNNVAIDEIIFAYERNDKIATARSREGVNEEMTKLVSKLKKDGTFNVTASVQDDGKFFYINRSYTILE
ncbi:MAG: energy transducer TonB [Saprospiraceae bacterium]